MWNVNIYKLAQFTETVHFISNHKIKTIKYVIKMRSKFVRERNVTTSMKVKN